MRRTKRTKLQKNKVVQRCLGSLVHALEEDVRLPPAAHAALQYYFKHGKLPSRFHKTVVSTCQKLNLPEAYSLPLVNSYYVKPLPTRVLAGVVFPQGDAVKDKLKENLDGLTYDRATKTWLVPVTYDNLLQLEAFGFFVPPPVFKFAKSRFNYPRVHPTDLGLPRDYLRKLFPFQRRGLAFIESRNGRCLINDVMGLGKTVQALAWCEAHQEKRPVLVICPASLKYNWAEEIIRWALTTPAVYVLDGFWSKELDIEDFFYKGDPDSDNIYVVVNYDILGNTKRGRGWINRLARIDFQVLIVDECHKIKNIKAKRTKAVLTIGQSTPHVIGLSGTPIQNGPHEFFTILKLVDPTIFPNYQEFLIRYCGAKKKPWGLELGEPTRIEELYNILRKTVMIRRRKEEVLKELPDKIRTFVPFKLDKKKMDIYYEHLQQFAEWAEQAGVEDSGAAILAKLASLRSLVANLKLSYVLNWIDDFLESGQKIIVFGYHRKVLEKIRQYYDGNAVLLYGGMSAKQKDEVVQQFLNDPDCRVFVGNILAAGEGLTLNVANNVCFVELDWVPGNLQQAEDRCHRIGQKNTVYSWYFMAQKTVEEILVDAILKKHLVVSQVLDGKSEEWFTRTAVTKVVQKLLDQVKRLPKAA